MSHGKLVMLNGTSSAGKSSILENLQGKLEDPYLIAGIDKFLYMLPKAHLQPPLWDSVMGKSSSAGTLGHQLISGMHHALLAMLKCGLNVLADHVLIEKLWVQEAAKLFFEIPAYLVGVHCPLAVIEARELIRKDRTLGSACLHFDIVHRWTQYDLEIDSSRVSPEEGADKLLDFLSLGIQPVAFKKILSLEG